MTESNDGGLRWPRIIAEGVVIVVSILLAFAVDAWRDNQGFRQREQAYLAGMRGEFAQAAVDADSLAEGAIDRAAWFAKLEAVLAEGETAVPLDSIWWLASPLW